MKSHDVFVSVFIMRLILSG